MAESCKTCRWWRTMTGSLVWGQCLKLDQKNGQVTIHGLGDIRPGWVETRDVFGCKLHDAAARTPEEGRDGQDEREDDDILRQCIED